MVAAIKTIGVIGPNADNRSILNKAGVDAAAIKTWDDFLSACEKINDAAAEMATGELTAEEAAERVEEAREMR